MNVERANTMLAQAARILDHVQGKNKADAKALIQIRSCIDAASFALIEDRPPAIEEVYGTSAASRRRRERFG